MGAWDAVDLHIAHPEGYDLDPEFTKNAVDRTHNLSQAIEGADYVYFKNWSALELYGSMPPTGTSWLLQPEELKNRAPFAQIMHCLPVRRNVEVVDNLLDSPQSLIVRQARNRVWSAQAVLAEILEQNG
jgi:N-succinyl-L-ornithine transcarbamylase